MLYAYILQLQNWVHWHILCIQEWMKQYPDRYHPGREQSTKDLRSLYTIFYELQLITEQ